MVLYILAGLVALVTLSPLLFIFVYIIARLCCRAYFRTVNEVARSQHGKGRSYGIESKTSREQGTDPQ